MSAVNCCASIRTLQLKINNLSPLFLPANGKRIRNFSNGLVKTGCRRFSMFLKTAPKVKDGVLRFNGTDVLVDVPDNVVMTPWSDSSAFIGAVTSERSSRNIFKLGVIEDARFLSLFRFKIWWMIPRVGKSGREIPVETQFLLLEKRESPGTDEDKAYVLFLPVLDGDFRSSLQGRSDDELEVCVESGDSNIIASEHPKAVFVNYGNNPFDLIKDSMKILQEYRGTFALRETKKMPEMLDWFGWCTWDAFYQEVNPQGIKDGLKSLYEGGTPARFLIIDDGWQDTINEFRKEDEGSQFGARLVSVRENHKFRRSDNEDSSNNNKPRDLKEFITDMRRTYGLKYVYVWHALMGYWGGLHPNAEGTKKYNPTLGFPLQSPGNVAHKRDLAMEAMERYGVGIIDSERVFEFYDDLHRYLASQGVNGVKVDVQNILETVSTGLGGRTSLTRHFQQALEKSIAKNFLDNGIICCMAQNTDSVYSSKTSAITRASDDYYPKNPTTQTLHIAAVAYNSLFFGEIVVPDWDMFYSQHESAEFHAVARAVGGCGIYVSDKPGKHDFTILKRLVLPDGSVLRAKYHGRPSRDCLFNDPVTDKTSLMKIWNLNKVTGVLAVFNCQGAGTWPCLDDDSAQVESLELSGYISPADLEYLREIVPSSWHGDFAVFSFKSGSVSRLSKHGKLSVTLQTLQCDVFTVTPIKVYDQTIEFAPVGLINMYNSGGAVDEIDPIDGDRIRVRGRGEGSFGAYSSTKPRICYVNTKETTEFEFNAGQRFFTVDIPRGTAYWEIVIHF